MRRSIVFKLTNNEYISECYFINGNKRINLNKYLIRTNRIINSFDNIKYKRIGFNEYEITDKRVLKAFLSRIPNLKASIKNISKQVIISTTILATLITSANAIKNAQNDPIIDEPKIDSLIEAEIPIIKEKDYTIENDIVFTFDYNDYINKTVTNEDNVTATQINNNENEIIIDDSLYNEDIPVFGFDYEDRSENEKINYARINYQEYVNKYARMYGLDSNLVMAILTQENAYNKINNTNIGANGVMQIESIWYNEEITAYNYEDEKYETECINANDLINPEYSIKIGCMILNNYYNTIFNKYYKNGTLSKSDCILATIIAYNKGITAISNLINTYNNTYLDHINETFGGDNNYLNHVSSYLRDMTKVEIENIEDDSSKIIFDNLTR